MIYYPDVFIQNIALKYYFITSNKLRLLLLYLSIMQYGTFSQFYLRRFSKSDATHELSKDLLKILFKKKKLMHFQRINMRLKLLFDYKMERCSKNFKSFFHESLQYAQDSTWYDAF